MTNPTPYECSCSKCVSACRVKPGWFLPGEAEHAAALLGKSFEAFFREHLAVDWWENYRGPHGDEDHRDVFVLSPALVGKRTGTEMPGNPGGRCVFLKDNRCSIHAAKPYECRMFLHGQTDGEVQDRKRYITEAWSKEQPRIEALLGREPVSEDWNPWSSGKGMYW